MLSIRRTTLALLLAALFALAGCSNGSNQTDSERNNEGSGERPPTPVETDAGGSKPGPTTSTPARGGEMAEGDGREPRSGGDLAEVERALRALEIRAEEEVPGYDREDWEHWSSADESGWPSRIAGESLAGCDAREATLIRDARKAGLTVSGDCEVSGVWDAPYSEERSRDSSEVHIDHIVPLSDAHDSGGHEFSAEEREAFANAPDNLIAASAGENMAKSDASPDEWLPPDQPVSEDECPANAPVKGNDSSSGELIYHEPGGAYYSVTNPEACFASAGAAEAAGYRASER